jgi:hypothetical protein
MYYTELNGAEPTVSIQVKDTKYTFTSESLVKLIEEKEVYKTELLQIERKLKNARFDVREFFQSRYETFDDEIKADINDVNELLTSIGSEQLTKSWSATVLITATVTGVEADNADEAKEVLEDAFEINLNIDGDVWVDDLTVDSVHPEA